MYALCCPDDDHQQVAQWQPKAYEAKNYPNTLDPLILGALMNDMGRVGWMIFKCGGNINDAHVALADIPVYFQGLWEKMCSRTRSRVMPIHIGVLQKRYETVRLFLDMGADPNVFGTEYTGELKRDLKRRNSLMADKREIIAEFAKEVMASNPMERIWKTKSAGLIRVFKG